MTHFARIKYPGAYYHIYNRGVNKHEIFFDDYDRKMFLKATSESVKKYNVNLFAFCLMDNHFHLFIQTVSPNLSEAIWHITSTYSRFFNTKYKRIGPLFQGRYKYRLVNENLYGKVLLRYIHNNPVKANIVTSPENYRWSSYGSYVKTLPEWNYLDTTGGLSMFNENMSYALSDIKEFHEQPIHKEEQEHLSDIKRSLF